MIISIDTNIILDILLPDPIFIDTSKKMLDKAFSLGGNVFSQLKT